MTASKSAPTERFSDRVEDYIRYRPRYSPEVVAALRSACGLRPEHSIVDVGCGTGLLAEIFLQNGNRVVGIEPNANMRRAGEQLLAGHAGFTMRDGSAEQTGLPSQCADFVVAGQAFHWFQPEATRVEFARVVKPGGWVVLVWHEREMESTAFLREYEAFLQKYATDYNAVAHNKVANYGALERFFAPDAMSLIEQATAQRFDLTGLRGRTLSSSYAPREGPGAEAMLQALPELFARYQSGGMVELLYRTKIYFGHLTA